MTTTTAVLKPLIKKSPVIPPVLFLLLLALAFALISSLRINSRVVLAPYLSNRSTTIAEKSLVAVDSVTRREFPLKCSNQTQTCPQDYYPMETVANTRDDDEGREQTCPDYFRWIHEDLRPWKSTGITRDMVERARPTAHFRLVIVKGRAYVEKFRKSIQTRDMFTIWGILQLLRRYPGRVPDLELMFDCDDRPVIRSKDYQGTNRTGPPPLFRYCGDRWTADIVFPDWSFWGWWVGLAYIPTFLHSSIFLQS